jgi:hypothetical protein
MDATDISKSLAYATTLGIKSKVLVVPFLRFDLLNVIDWIKSDIYIL